LRLDLDAEVIEELHQGVSIMKSRIVASAFALAVIGAIRLPAEPVVYTGLDGSKGHECNTEDSAPCRCETNSQGECVLIWEDDSTSGCIECTTGKAQSNPTSGPRTWPAFSGPGQLEGIRPFDLEPELGWTRWLNRDRPGGSGDYETLRDFLAAGAACEHPTAVECRTTQGIDWRKAGQRYTCSPAQGGVCSNSKQKAGKPCLDYEVRFKCGSEPQYILTCDDKQEVCYCDSPESCKVLNIICQATVETGIPGTQRGVGCWAKAMD
jgi:hypothetical protein